MAQALLQPSLKSTQPKAKPLANKAVQAKVKVAPTNSPLEKEADTMADRVMLNKSKPRIQNMPITQIHKKGKSNIEDNLELNLESALQNGIRFGGEIKNEMEAQFGADFSKVMLHTDSKASQLAENIGARAFTFKNHIFFNEGEFTPNTSQGKWLLAHELTHVLQQGSATSDSRHFGKAEPSIQKFDLGVLKTIKNFITDKVSNFSGFNLANLLAGKNIVTGEQVASSTEAILIESIGLMPEGEQIKQTLDKYNQISKAAVWIDTKIAGFKQIVNEIIFKATAFFNKSDLSHLLADLSAAWSDLKQVFSKPLSDLFAFIKKTAKEILGFIIDFIKGPLAKEASKTKGWDLTCVILGKNIITDEKVERTPEALIGGFMKLIEKQEVWENIQKGKAVQKAMAWVETNLVKIKNLSSEIPNKILAFVKGLRAIDFIDLMDLAKKVLAFGLSIIQQILNWATDAVFDLLEIIVQVVAPESLPYLKKSRDSFHKIINDPIIFIKFLIKATKEGFVLFKNNIVSHLKKGVTNWILGSLKGAELYIPQSFSTKEIFKFVLSIFGISWPSLRKKLVEKKEIGEAKVNALEEGFELVKILITEGIGAAWEKIKEHIEKLKTTIIDKVIAFVAESVVGKAITKLLSMLNPVGAFIQAILTIYSTIQFLIEKIQQIIEVGKGVLNSINDIVDGNTIKAAQKVEKIMGNMLGVMINFLAYQVGLHKISEKIVEIVQKIKKIVDNAIDKLIDWIVEKGTMLWGKTVEFSKKVGEKFLILIGLKKPFKFKNEQHTLTFEEVGGNAVFGVKSTFKKYSEFIKSIDTWDNSKNYNSSKFGKNKPKEDALEGGHKVDALIVNFKGKTDEEKRVWGNEVSKALNGISLIIENFTLVNSAPIIKWGGVNNSGVANFVNVKNLKKGNFVEGSDTSDARKYMPSNYVDLIEHFDANFIMGHLLNAKLGGEGNNTNLSPITGAANKIHETNVENNIKSAVLDSSKTLTSYQVKAIYNSQNVTFEGEDDQKDISDLINKNKISPTSFECKWIIDGESEKSYSVKNSIPKVRNLGSKMAAFNFGTQQNWNMDWGIEKPSQKPDGMVNSKDYKTAFGFTKDQLRKSLKSKGLLIKYQRLEYKG